MPIPNKGEHKIEYLQRCMSDEETKSKYPDESQRFAVCNSLWYEDKMSALTKYKDSFATKKISFDYDGVLSTSKGTELAKRLKDEGNTIYIISARGSKDNMLSRVESIGIPTSRIYATGSNKAKVEKIKELGIDIHYDNNPDVIKELDGIGKLF